MSSTTLFDGIRGVNAFYHSVIEEVTGHLQTLLDEEKEEERKRIRKILENRLKDERAKAAEKKPARKGSKNKSSEMNAGAKAEVKRLEALLKKPAEKLFMPDIVISDLRHTWLQNLRVKTTASSSKGAVSGPSDGRDCPKTTAGASSSKGAGPSDSGARPKTTAEASSSKRAVAEPSDGGGRSKASAEAPKSSKLLPKRAAKYKDKDKEKDRSDQDPQKVALRTKRDVNGDSDHSSADEEGEDEDEDSGGPDTDPLCSDDDISDDPDEMFACADVVHCKSAEVSRERGGKWRIKLKEGVANLAGKDLLFKECNSDLLDFY